MPKGRHKFPMGTDVLENVHQKWKQQHEDFDRTHNFKENDPVYVTAYWLAGRIKSIHHRNLTHLADKKGFVYRTKSRLPERPYITVWFNNGETIIKFFNPNLELIKADEVTGLLYD